MSKNAWGIISAVLAAGWLFWMSQPVKPNWTGFMIASSTSSDPFFASGRTTVFTVSFIVLGAAAFCLYRFAKTKGSDSEEE